MARCLISFGANIGDAWSTIQSAAARVRELLCSDAVSLISEATESAFRLSRCFRTPPVGGPAGQPPFINAVAAVSTAASIWDVWHCIRTVEKEFGRERNLRWEARRIDLDILLYDDLRIWTPHLKVPHPRLCMRRFILLPAVDVASDWLDPVSGWTIGQLADNLRTGAGNFVLLGKAESNPESLLAEVARRTGAEWRDVRWQGAGWQGPGGQSSGGSLKSASLPSAARMAPTANRGRWVSAFVRPPGHDVSSEADERFRVNEFFAEPQSDKFATKLLIALAPKVRAADVAWEDYHQELAIELGLRPRELVAVDSGSEDQTARLRWRGPRYLLAGDDLAWAVQELTAALEAMDCPIELA